MSLKATMFHLQLGHIHYHWPHLSDVTHLFINKTFPPLFSNLTVRADDFYFFYIFLSEFSYPPSVRFSFSLNDLLCIWAFIEVTILKLPVLCLLCLLVEKKRH